MKEVKNIEDKYKVLDQISHVLLRPQTYVGSNKPNTSNRYVLEDGKMVKKEVTYIPSFLKIFDEVITNSVDENKRNPKLNKVEVVIGDDGRITITDNGGIPVVIHGEHGLYVPEVIFGNLMAGSNYNDDEERIGAGTNGLGSKLSNIFSVEFKVSTCDGENGFTQTFSNNMRDREPAKIKKLKRNHTEISFLPDYEKFGMNGIDEDHFKVLEKRVYDLAGCNPSMNFYFNGKLIEIKSFENYIKMYMDDFFFEEAKDKSWSIGVGVSENGFSQISFVNSTETYDGGTHIDYILNQIITELRLFFNKKHKVDIKPSDLKSHIFIFINSTVVNPAFGSQTKEKLITEVKDFGYSYTVSKKLIQSILKSEIVESILDWIDRKKNAEENKQQRELNKKLSKIKVDKLIDAKSSQRDKCSLGLFEGDSAASAFRRFSNEFMGSFSLRGKFVNVNGMPNSKLAKVEEAVKLMASIGLKLGEKATTENLRYGKIYIYADADVDGNCISAQLISFFHTFWPEVFDLGMVYRVQSPIMVLEPKATALKNKTKKSDKIFIYTLTEYENWLKGNDISKYQVNYKKGLASLLDDEYEDIIKTPKLIKITKDELSGENLDKWFAKDSAERKNLLLD